MSALLLESFEEVRVVSAQLREDSQGIRTKATHLRERSARLMERSSHEAACAPWFVPPPAEALHEAESRLLEIFKGENRREKQDRGFP
jgi:hypothetical protein